MYGEAFRSHVAGASGWAWLDEGKPGKRKWGYISTTPGSVLTIKVRGTQGLWQGSAATHVHMPCGSHGTACLPALVQLDTRRTSAPAPGADGGRMNVMLAYLK